LGRGLRGYCTIWEVRERAETLKLLGILVSYCMFFGPGSILRQIRKIKVLAKY